VAGDNTARIVSDLFRWGPRRAEPEGAVSLAQPGGGEARVLPSKILPKFLAAVARCESPVLVDLGPVVGSNITFFGERLHCKIFVEDLCGEIEQHACRSAEAELPAFFESRFAGRAVSADGVLCWDVFDFLDRPAAQVLATCLARMVKPGGALLGFFGTADAVRRHYTKFEIVDDARLRHRPYPATGAHRHVLLNRDIIRMFEGLEVSEQVLLQINVREILFRKP
jgi:hypothetical protein